MRRDSDRWRWSIIFVFIAIFVIIADQVSKNWIRFYTGDWPIFEFGIFRIIEVHNTGSSFGMFQQQNPLLMVVAAAGILLVLTAAVVITIKYPSIDTWETKLTLGLILGGATGNFIDRIVYGHVTDFIDIGPWPTFNVADSAMVVGTIGLVLYIIFSPRVRALFPDRSEQT